MIRRQPGLFNLQRGFIRILQIQFLYTKLSTTQIYARVIETKISEDMDNLLKRFETKGQTERQTNF